MPQTPNRLALEVIGDIGDDNARAEEQARLQAQCCLVMQDCLPPMRSDIFWQHHRNDVMRMLAAHQINIGQQRRYQ